MTHLLRRALASLSLALLCPLAAAQAPAPAPAATMPSAGTNPGPRVRLATSAGDIVLVLEADKAPATVDNFVRYVRAGHYDGTIFHRVIDGFMIQGGGMTAQMTEKATRAPIPLEVGRGLSNQRGTVAMARTSDPNSATAQFFINVADNLRLDSAGGGYAVFGRVVEGMDVVDQIRSVAVQPRGPHTHTPVTPVLIRKASLEQ